MERIDGVYCVVLCCVYLLFITGVGRMQSDVKVELSAVLSSCLVSSSVYNMTMQVGALQGRWTMDDGRRKVFCR